jgi:hypothetical protein
MVVNGLPPDPPVDAREDMKDGCLRRANIHVIVLRDDE